MVVGQLNKILFSILFSVSLIQSSYCVEFKGKFEQGSFILGITDPDSKVTIDDKKVKVTKNGYFVFGLGRDRKNNVIIKVFKDKKIETYEKIVLKRKYKIQKIDGLPEKKVTPPKEVYERISRENKIIVNAREIESD